MIALPKAYAKACDDEALKQSESRSVVDELKVKLEAKTKERERLAVQLDKLKEGGVKLWAVLSESNQQMERKNKNQHPLFPVSLPKGAWAP